MFASSYDGFGHMLSATEKKKERKNRKTANKLKNSTVPARFVYGNEALKSMLWKRRVPETAYAHAAYAQLERWPANAFRVLKQTGSHPAGLQYAYHLGFSVAITFYFFQQVFHTPIPFSCTNKLYEFSRSSLDRAEQSGKPFGKKYAHRKLVTCATAEIN